jgi:hypothetical protein
VAKDAAKDAVESAYWPECSRTEPGEAFHSEQFGGNEAACAGSWAKTTDPRLYRPMRDHCPGPPHNSHAGGHWFDPSHAHSDPRSDTETRMAARVICARRAANTRAVPTPVPTSDFA